MRAIYVVVFIVVWIAGCALADVVFDLGANSWRMMFGAIVYMVADGIGQEIERRAKA